MAGDVLIVPFVTISIMSVIRVFFFLFFFFNKRKIGRFASKTGRREMEGKKGESPAENRRVGIFVHILFFIKIQIIIPHRATHENLRWKCCYNCSPTLRVRTVAKGTWDLPCLLHLLFWFHVSNYTLIFGITKDGSLVSNHLASWNCFTCRNLFKNGANDMSEWLTCETAFCKKAQNFV